MLAATGLFDRLENARFLERFRSAVMHLGAVRNEVHDDPFRFGGVRCSEHVDSIRLEGAGGPLHAAFVLQGSELAAY